MNRHANFIKILLLSNISIEYNYMTVTQNFFVISFLLYLCIKFPALINVNENLRQIFRQHFTRSAQISKELAIFKTDRSLYASYSGIAIKNLFLFRGLKVREKSYPLLAQKNFCYKVWYSWFILAICSANKNEMFTSR